MVSDFMDYDYLETKYPALFGLLNKTFNIDKIKRLTKELEELKMKEIKMPKPKPTNVNNRGFHTKNNTQDMSKGTPRERGANNKSMVEIPSGEDGLPNLH